MEHPERVYTRGQMLDRVWGGNVYVEERTVDVHIRRLRKALEPFAATIWCRRCVAPAIDSRHAPNRRLGGRCCLNKPAWQHVLVIFSGLLVVSSRGWIAGRPALYAALFLLAVVAWQSWQLIRFERWLRLRAHLTPPDMNGLWGEVVATAHRIHRRKAFHKRRVLRAAARIPPHDVGDAGRRDPARPASARSSGSTGTAGRWLDLRRKVDYGIRIDNLVRHPEFVEYVEKRRRRACRRASTCRSRATAGSSSTWSRPMRGAAAADRARRDRARRGSSACARTSSRTRRTSCVRRSP